MHTQLLARKHKGMLLKGQVSICKTTEYNSEITEEEDNGLKWQNRLPETYDLNSGTLACEQ